MARHGDDKTFENKMYNEKIMEYFLRPKNMGKPKEYDAVGTVGNPVCGDLMKMYIKVADGKIADIGFETLGCAAAIANSSITTELAKGKTLSEAEMMEFEEVNDALGGLPPAKVHCAKLAVSALREAIKEYRSRKI